MRKLVILRKLILFVGEKQTVAENNEMKFDNAINNSEEAISVDVIEVKNSADDDNVEKNVEEIMTLVTNTDHHVRDIFGTAEKQESQEEALIASDEKDKPVLSSLKGNVSNSVITLMEEQKNSTSSIGSGEKIMKESSPSPSKQVFGTAGATHNVTPLNQEEQTLK